MDGLHEPYDRPNEGPDEYAGDGGQPLDPLSPEWDGFITAPGGEGGSHILDEEDDIPDDASPDELAAAEAPTQGTAPQGAGRVVVEHEIEVHPTSPEQPAPTEAAPGAHSAPSEAASAAESEPAEEREVHQGEIVRGGPEDAYGRDIATKEKVLLHAPEEVSNRALLATVRSATDKLPDNEGELVIAVANFNQRTSPLIEQADGSYNVVSGRVIDAQGFYASLKGEQQDRVIGRAASAVFEGGVAESLAFRDIHRAVRTALERYKETAANEAGISPADTDIRVNPLEIRDGIGLLGGRRGSEIYGEAPNLPDLDARRAVMAAMSEDEIKTNRTTIERLKQFMAAALPPEEDGLAHAQAANSSMLGSRAAGGITLAESHVDASDPDDIAVQGGVLAESLLSITGAKTPHGRQKILVVEGAEHVNPETLGAVAERCGKLGVQLILTAGSLTPELAHMLPGSFAAVGRRPAADAAAASEAYGNIIRTEVQGGTHSRGWNTSEGTSYQEAASWGEFPTKDPKGGSASDSNNKSGGVNRGYTQNVAVGEGRRYTQADFEGIGEEDIVLLNPDGSIFGIHHAFSGDMPGGIFPLPREEVLNERAAIDPYLDGQRQLPGTERQQALPSGSQAAAPRQLSRPESLPRRNLQPYQEAGEILANLRAARMGSTRVTRAHMAWQYYCDNYTNPTPEGFWKWVDKTELTGRLKFSDRDIDLDY